MALGVISIWQWYQVLRSLPRVIRLPNELTGGKEHHIMLTAVIHGHIEELFPGMTVTGCHQFRLTRNADLDLADDVEDLAKALEGELENRRFGAKVRLGSDYALPTINGGLFAWSVWT